MKTIFFDLDDTLLDVHSKQIERKNIETLQKLKTKGYKLGIATSRPLERVENIPHIDEIDWDGYVLINGTMVLDKNRQVIEDHSFQLPELRAIFSFGKQENVPMFAVGEIEMLTEINDTVKQFMKKYTVVDYQLKPYEDENEKLITYITPHVESFYQKLKKRFPTYNVVKGGPFNMDIFPKGYSKLTGVHVLMDRLQEPENDFMAFGDAMADVCTLQAGKIGVAMHHAMKEAKAVADYVCPEDRPDAITQAIDHYGLL